MARPSTNGSSNSVLPEFMTAESVGDFMTGWLAEQIERAEREAHEAGNSRALAWELRTLKRAHGQLVGYVQAIHAEEG
jgi:hypothetical protein